MKKKLKDVTMGELFDHCFRTFCVNCPLYNSQCPRINDLYQDGGVEIEIGKSAENPGQ